MRCRNSKLKTQLTSGEKTLMNAFVRACVQIYTFFIRQLI